MSKETDAYYRQGYIDGFRRGFYEMHREVQNTISSLTIHDKLLKKCESEVRHAKDFKIEGDRLSFKYSRKRIK